MTDWDCTIVGGGVVGLACAALLSRAGRTTLLLEQHARLGQENSSRNSGVVHAGIYFPPGSLKTKLCVRGRRLLYDRCIRDGVPFSKLGKLVVATSQQEEERLLRVKDNADRIGVELSWLSAGKVAELEPALSVRAALWSPESGIVDAHELMRSYRAEASDFGATFALSTALEGLRRLGQGWRLECVTLAGEQERFVTTTGVVVNAAGLDSARIWELASGQPVPEQLRVHFCKGDYFALSSRWAQKIRRLVYPLPVEAGLGVHLTLDLGGALLAGPDAQYVTDRNVEPRPEKAEAFARSLRRFLPGVEASDLRPAYSGIRPKLQPPGGTPRDFCIRADRDGPLAGFVHLAGIESPGLTASEAIAERVRDLVLELDPQ